LDPGTCAALSISKAAGSRFIQTPDKKFFLVEDGKKRPLSNRAQYEALRAGGPAFISVDNTFASRVPTGAAVKAGATAVSDEVSAEPIAAPAPVNTQPTPTPTRTPTATPTPTPTRTPAPAPVPPTSSKAKSYTVKAGDTLTGIAERFGTTSKRLRDLNNLSSDVIQIGKVLKLPGAAKPAPAPETAPKTYKIKRGDSLSQIADRFGTTTRKLMNLNGITDSNLIRIGQVIKLP
jgi:LysM repeat protein